jgi:hypothetical protein
MPQNHFSNQYSRLFRHEDFSDGFFADHRYPGRSASMYRLIWTATRGVMEILGLVPSNPRRNTSKQNLECWPRGNIVEIRFHFVSSLFPLPVTFTQRVEIWRKYFSTPVSTSELHIINEGNNCNARKTLPICLVSI